MTIKTTAPSLLTRLYYRLLCWAFGIMTYRQKAAWRRYRKWDARIEVVHRPIRVLGARHMKELVNGN